MSGLLVLAPLRIEQLALGEPAGSSVIRTGMGPDRARIAAARALAHDAARRRGRRALRRCRPRPSRRRRRLRDRAGRRDGHAGARAGQLAPRRGAPASRPPGPRRAARLRDRILGPSERRGHEGSALAVDMESAWLAAGAAGRPLAVVRVVADEAGRSLADPRMAVAGPRALRSLRRVSGALGEWAAAVGPRTLLLAGPRSFCAGVDRAVEHAVRAVAREADVVLVAGSEALVEVARREGAKAHLVDDETDVDVAWLAGAETVGITAGASAPERIVHSLVAALASLGPVDVEERTQTEESLRFRLPKEL